MRNAFADEMVKIARTDPRLVLLSGDIGNKLFDGFKEAAADRFYNCGVAEANLIGMAAGMALSGLRPVAYTIAPFITARCYEQIRIDVCYHRAPVTIVGVGCGLGYASLGATHHSCDDMAIMRALPGMIVVSPADALELRAALRCAVSQDSPVYIRIGKKGEPVVHDTIPEPFAFGDSFTLRQGSDICLFATGTIVPEVLHAADILQARSFSTRVVSVPTVKPLNEEIFLRAAAEFQLLVTVEEHGLIGGLGSAVAERLTDTRRAHAPLLRLGTPDEFFHGGGDTRRAREEWGLTGPHIAARIGAALGREW